MVISCIISRYNLFTWVLHENELDPPHSSAPRTSTDIQNLYMTHTTGARAIEIIRVFLGYL